MQKNTYSSLTAQEKTEVVNHVKKLHQTDHFAQQMSLQKGDVCYRFVAGDTLTSDEYNELEEADKIPVQSTELLTKLASIIGMLSQTAKDGIVVGNGPEDAADAELRTRILKDYIEDLSMMDRAESKVAQDSLVTGVCSFLWMEPFDPRDPSEPGLYVRAMNWKSVIPDAAWRDPSMRDMRRIHRHLQLSIDDVIAQGFAGVQGLQPWQVKEMEEAAYRSVSVHSDDYTAARNGDSFSSTGLLNVVETLEWRRIVWTIAYDQFGNGEPLPPSWDEEQIQRFAEMNPDIHLVKENERILWSTVWTTSGILLDYGPHWLQIKEFPCEPFVLADINGAWSGIIEHAIEHAKAMTYARTEHLHGIRQVNNGLWKVKEGAVKDLEEFEIQRKTPGGTIVVASDKNLDDVNPVENVRENQAFVDWFNMNSDALDRQTVERNFEGGAQASQESSKAIGARITQTVSKLQFFLQGYNIMRLGIRRKLVKAMPFAIPEGKILRLIDKKNGAVTQYEVGKPEEFDIEGNAAKRINRLDAADYDFTFTDADNSINGQATQREIVNEFLRYSANIPPEMIIAAAKTYPSTAVQAYGAELEAIKKAQDNAPPKKPEPKVSLSISSADIGTDATLTVMRDQGLLPVEPPIDQSGMQGTAQGSQEEMMEGAGANPMEAIPENLQPTPNEMEM